jgi:hypothetical protein
MSINNINNPINTTSNYDYGKKDYPIADKGTKNEDKAVIKEADSYVPSSQANERYAAKTYTRDTATIDSLKMEVEKQTQQLRDIVEKLILQQGNKYKESGSFEVDKETAAKALEDISEDGFWGVEETSKRIFDFAIALSGGDPEKAQVLKDAVIKGFEQAKEAWGGQLPEISNKTYDATIKLFDQWIEDNKE